MRIFLDANVLFSAAKSNGAVRDLLERLLAARHELHADGFVAEEARRNLAAKATAPALPALITLLSRLHVAAAQPARRAPLEVHLPERDRPVLEAAIRQGCAMLITGDRTHFGPYFGRVVEGVRICSPRMAAEELLGRT